jgi:hypothetical protein
MVSESPLGYTTVHLKRRYGLLYSVCTQNATTGEAVPLSKVAGFRIGFFAGSLRWQGFRKNRLEKIEYNSPMTNQCGVQSLEREPDQTRTVGIPVA